MNDINDWKRYYGEERVKRAELEVATDELVEAAEMVLACLDQPRSRDNSEHAGLDAAEALRKATGEVKELKRLFGVSAYVKTYHMEKHTMKFEIINPSDACTMYAPDLEVAAVAVSFLGDGKYPLEGLDDAAGQGVPAFLFGGHDEWFSSKFGMSFQATAEHVMNHRNEELASTLDSVTLRGTRSSMNDIAGRARSLAQAVRRKAASSPVCEDDAEDPDSDGHDCGEDVCVCAR